MKVYRYNTERKSRKFNQTGEEKNPNRVKFYAKSAEYAEKYRFVFDDNGFQVEEAILEVIEVSEKLNLFDMDVDFATLSTFGNYINSEIAVQKRDYTRFLNEAKKVRDRTMWENAIAELKNREIELVQNLKHTQFQALSDFERQNELIAELKSLGYEGYETEKEIAIV